MTLFPYKLHGLLTDVQADPQLSSIISWMPSGKAFKIHQPELFEEVLLQKYFPRQTQLNSFKRQLMHYGFDNLGYGIFAHPCFLKDNRHLCGQITNTTDPSKRVRGKHAKQALRQVLVKAAAKANKTSKKATKNQSLPATEKPASSLPVAAPMAPVAKKEEPTKTPPSLLTTQSALLPPVAAPPVAARSPSPLTSALNLINASTLQQVLLQDSLYMDPLGMSSLFMPTPMSPLGLALQQGKELRFPLLANMPANLELQGGRKF